MRQELRRGRLNRLRLAVHRPLPPRKDRDRRLPSSKDTTGNGAGDRATFFISCLRANQCGNSPLMPEGGRANLDWTTGFDEYGLMRFSGGGERAACPWPAINDAAVRRPPYVSRPYLIPQWSERAPGGRWKRAALGLGRPNGSDAKLRGQGPRAEARAALGVHACESRDAGRAPP